MINSRRSGIALLFATTLLMNAPLPSIAQSPPTHEIVRDSNVEWTLPRPDDQCSSLPTGLVITGTGERHQVINTKVNADGSTETLINDVVRGTASDNQGGTYHFIYTNHSIDILTAGGSVHQIDMVDSFVLNGNGSAKHISVGFNWIWSYTDPNGPFDVIPLANLVERQTSGDPLHCDPL